jgi:hypothetical protein
LPNTKVRFGRIVLKPVATPGVGIDEGAFSCCKG